MRRRHGRRAVTPRPARHAGPVPGLPLRVLGSGAAGHRGRAGRPSPDAGILRMKAHQRLIREKLADSGGDLFGRWWEKLDNSLVNAEIREIDYSTAKTFILEYEWLGNMGTTEYAIGLYCSNALAGVACFGRTGGTNVYKALAGIEAARCISLVRGACAHWAHPHAASFLISGACKLMGRHGYNIFVAYADSLAGEIGTVYQACNWIYTGQTSPSHQMITPDGLVKDSRLISAYTRDRRGGKLRYKRTWSEQKKMLINNGYTFFKGNPKHRYVGVYAPPNVKRKLIQVLHVTKFPYPKREAEMENRPRMPGF